MQLTNGAMMIRPSERYFHDGCISPHPTNVRFDILICQNHLMHELLG